MLSATRNLRRIVLCLSLPARAVTSTDGFFPGFHMLSLHETSPGPQSNMTGPWAPLLYRRPLEPHRSTGTTRRRNWGQTPVPLTARPPKQGHSVSSTSTCEPFPSHAEHDVMLSGQPPLHSEQRAGQRQAWTPQGDGREPPLKDDTWRRSQAALTDVGSVTADQEFVPGLPLRTAPCSPSSSRASPPAASCWP